jgi:hypothetical protein
VKPEPGSGLYLHEATDEERERFDDQLVLNRGDGTEDDWHESLRLALNDFLARRRDAIDVAKKEEAE